MAERRRGFDVLDGTATQLRPKSPKDGLVKQFMGRGASRTTLYRWASELEASGKPDQHVVRKVREAAAARAAIAKQIQLPPPLLTRALGCRRW